MPHSEDFFTDGTHWDRYEAVADTLGDVYNDAVSLRNTFADTTLTGDLRRDGRALHESLESVATDAEDLLREITEPVEGVDTDYMVQEGWELSYHDPEDLPAELVFACRVVDRIVNARNRINWLFDDALSQGVPDGEDITAAADRVAGQFPVIASMFDVIGIDIPGVEPENQTQSLSV